jgi:hypothetical protein
VYAPLLTVLSLSSIKYIMWLYDSSFFLLISLGSPNLLQLFSQLFYMSCAVFLKMKTSLPVDPSVCPSTYGAIFKFNKVYHVAL